ncbi:MAG: hypothetical protein ACE5HS_16570 [bacterium]
MAAPFVQGQLRKEKLSVIIETECACCAQPMRFELDSDLNYRFHLPGAQPLVFEPNVD